MKLANTRTTVVGLGASGLASARLLRAQGAVVTVNDARGEEQLAEQAEQARALGAKLHLGAHSAERLKQNDLVVVSPGVPRLAELDEAERAGVKIVSEVELASWFLAGSVVAVTGTNGKSTVVSLVGDMCARSGAPTFVGGNLGTPLATAVGTEAAAPGGVVVVELSSFQLERVERFRANVAVLLNVTDDHLDRYDSFADYAAAKGRIFAGQRREDAAVVSFGDALCEAMAQAAASRVQRFGGAQGDVRVEGGFLVDPVSGLRLAVDRIGITGAHNLSNASAAALAARLAGVQAPEIAASLTAFNGLAHRMQHAGVVGEVAFYDDSKATNVGAAVAAVEGLGLRGERVVLIAGGKDKGGSYAPLREALERHGAGLVCLGEAASLIAREFAESSLAQRAAGSMDEAVRSAFDIARERGAAVLLAPACSSFDMFRSYAERGDVFCRAVSQLAEEHEREVRA